MRIRNVLDGRLQREIPEQNRSLVLNDRKIRPVSPNGSQEEEKVVRGRGFEPLTPSVSGRCSTTELTARSPRLSPLLFAWQADRRVTSARAQVGCRAARGRATT